MDLRDRIKQLDVPEGRLAIFWLGNAGFALKSAQGDIIYLDPYLSDCAQRLYGFKRLYPTPIGADDVEADCVLISHQHGDHFDIDSLPTIMKQDDIKLLGPQPCIEQGLELGISEEKLVEVEEGSKESFTNFEVLTVFADHGDLAPQAVGYILNFGDLKLYYTGDTAYSPDKMKQAFSLQPEILIAPINGKFNNLNSIEAALLARDCRAEVVIPAHFWMFAQHNGSLGKFIEYVDQIAQETDYELITQGDCYLYS
ncbi:MBL fold metallo-hydrolase [Natroniella acetigena]|uniref:MBL fold metallo-hydrolase n=1 Tax=Natroniella acetigena TaxID=52004 RepID=UPI00200A719B|nr:MBL fold metallo-hydrolase [Natroniella acetigena]MCK8827416.1 MBL fold metallo-hydrolase [Natroniella acetigena]